MKKQNIIILSLFTASIVYLVLRSIFVPLVHDEAATFFHYIIKGEFSPWTSLQDANNHVFNSFLEIGSYRLFGQEPWALRLPNVLSFFLFLWALYKVSLYIKNKILSIGFIVILIATQGFFEFFALGRGYGISMAFFLTSIWMVIEFAKSKKNLHFFLFVVTISAAVFANLTLLVSALALFGYAGLVFITSSTKKSLCANGIIYGSTLLFLINMIVFAKLAFHFQATGKLYYGSNNGFYETSLQTLYRFLFPHWSSAVFIASVIVFAIALIGYCIYIFKEKISTIFLAPQTLFFLLLVGNISASIFLSTFLGVHFGEDRTVMYLYPIITGFIFFSFDNFQNIRLKPAIYSVLLLLIIPIHFVANMNISYSSLWKNENIKEDVFKIVWDDVKKSNQIPTVSGNHIFKLVWLNYNIKLGDPILQINHDSYPNTSEDYVLALKEDAPMFAKDYTLLDVNNNSGIHLFRRNKFLETTPIVTLTDQSPKEFSSQEYFQLIEDTTILSTHASIKVRTKFDFLSDKSPSGNIIVVNTLDACGNTLKYISLDLGWMGKNQKTKQTYDFHFSLIKNENTAHTLKVYVWNPRKNAVKVTNTTLELEEVME